MADITEKVIDQILPAEMRNSTNVVGWELMISRAVQLTMEHAEADIAQRLRDNWGEDYDGPVSFRAVLRLVEGALND